MSENNTESEYVMPDLSHAAIMARTESLTIQSGISADGYDVDRTIDTELGHAVGTLRKYVASLDTLEPAYKVDTSDLALRHQMNSGVTKGKALADVKTWFKQVAVDQPRCIEDGIVFLDVDNKWGGRSWALPDVPAVIFGTLLPSAKHDRDLFMPGQLECVALWFDPTRNKTVSYESKAGNTYDKCWLFGKDAYLGIVAVFPDYDACEEARDELAAAVETIRTAPDHSAIEFDPYQRLDVDETEHQWGEDEDSDDYMGFE